MIIFSNFVTRDITPMKKRLIYIFLGLCLNLFTQAVPYKISYLTADNGLSRNLVDCIFKDSRGFIWFGTSKGIDRYDGYEFVHFDSRNLINNLPNDNVHCIEEDVNGNIWIGTENGLFLMKYPTGEIINITHKLELKPGFENRQIIFINKDDQDNLWVGHNAGLS